MANPFSYLELHSSAPDKAKDFYRKLFDWSTADQTIPAPKPFTYTNVKTGEGPPAGLRPQGIEAAQSHWLPYVDVSDLGAAVKKARDLGGSVLLERAEVPGAGWYAWVRDPSGAALGLFESDRRAEGASDRGPLGGQKMESR